MKNKLFDESFDIVKKAMKDVIQEIVITLEDGTPHIVYIHKLNFADGQIHVDFSTLSEDRKAELAPVVEKCIIAQIEHVKTKKKRVFGF